MSETRTFVRDGVEVQACACQCHHEGLSVMHCVPCCNLTYDKYIVDGKVDYDKLEIALQAHVDYINHNKSQS